MAITTFFFKVKFQHKIQIEQLFPSHCMQWPTAEKGAVQVGSISIDEIDLCLQLFRQFHCLGPVFGNPLLPPGLFF